MAFSAGMTLNGKSKALALIGAISTLKLALYSTKTGLDCAGSNLAYTTSGELTSASTGYTAGGYALASAAVTASGQTAQLTFADVVTGSGTIASGDYGAMIYDTENSNYAYAVFTCTISTGSSSGTMTIDLPAAAISLA